MLEPARLSSLLQLQGGSQCQCNSFSYRHNTAIWREGYTIMTCKRHDERLILTSAPSRDFFNTATTSSWKATSSTHLGLLQKHSLFTWIQHVGPLQTEICFWWGQRLIAVRVLDTDELLNTHTHTQIYRPGHMYGSHLLFFYPGNSLGFLLCAGSPCFVFLRSGSLAGNSHSFQKGLHDSCSLCPKQQKYPGTNNPTEAEILHLLHGLLNTLTIIAAHQLWNGSVMLVQWLRKSLTVHHIQLVFFPP